MHKMSIRGFTLIEMLVVVGILAILMAIIIPSMGKVRARAIATKCSSNTRQCVQALHQYANDNQGKFAPYYDPNDAASKSWSDYLRPYTVSLKVGDPSNTGQRWDPKSIFNCPAVEVVSTYKSNPLAPYGVDYASTLGYSFAVSASRWRYLRAKVTAPSETILVGDMGVTDDDRIATSDGFRIQTPTPFTTDTYGQDGNGGEVAGRHNELANMAFVDAHVEAMKTNDLTKTSTKWIWYTVN